MDKDRLNQIEINLRSNRIDLRTSALDELANLDSDMAIPILERLYQEKDFLLRRFAVMGLGNHRTGAVWEILSNILETEQDHNVLSEAANSLFEFGDRSVPILKQLFTGSNHWLVRQTVISILVDSNNPEVLMDVATLALKDEDQTTKETGILALSRLLNTPLKQQAIDLFAQLAQDNYWRTRWRTAIALTASSDPQVKQLLAQLQKDEHYRVVAAALEEVK